MPAYRDEETGKWFVKFYCKNWHGQNKQIKKRGFETKRDALDFERHFKVRESRNLDMTFGDFYELYTADRKIRLKENTWASKEHVIRTKILPYFKDVKINEIEPADVVKWQNELMEMYGKDGKKLSETYRKTIHSQLSAIFNHACKYYGLKKNPAQIAGNMGKEETAEMQFWTKEEYHKFSEALIDHPVAYYAFEVLYWTGIRLGELLALTMEDFDEATGTLRINKSYQRLNGRDLITEPKTKKSNRVIKIPHFLMEEMQTYFETLYQQKKTDPIFPVTKSYMHHQMDYGSEKAGVKRIRIHDLRHSHVSLLIDEGFSAVAIAERLGHESIAITYRYSHLFPTKQSEMADRLDDLKERMESDNDE